ncbi:hypothetical protein HC931_26210 [Candidatus Gracilibacteria bacterium]|nr:hypothetical protein [Candidatus Gracilibacteria bacterium]NJM88071.1 hypothetical protein [Hydrococcus sp. RU_2_2]NJP22136.1 hypothetical protein [Hydrococcus sp. CRU_1_1]NJQ96818.1 hypothetical protein [Hydrococcus sp. CSU_1_8]
MSIVNNVIDEMMPEFDPTNPDADYGDAVRVSGDAVLNAVSSGAAGNAFSQVSQGIEDLNELTNNALTTNNIAETVEEVGDFLGSLF